MDLIRFLKDFFHVDGSGNTAVKYAQGQTYPATEETTSQVAAGVAEVVAQVPPGGVTQVVGQVVAATEGTTSSEPPVAQPAGNTASVTAPAV